MNKKLKQSTVAELRRQASTPGSDWDGLYFLDSRFDRAIVGVAGRCSELTRVTYDHRLLKNMGFSRKGHKLDVIIVDRMDDRVSRDNINKFCRKWHGGVMILDDSTRGFLGTVQVSPRKAVAIYDEDKTRAEYARKFVTALKKDYCVDLKKGRIEELPTEDELLDEAWDMATDHMGYNVVDAWVGSRTPFFMTTLEGLYL